MAPRMRRELCSVFLPGLHVVRRDAAGLGQAPASKQGRAGGSAAKDYAPDAERGKASASSHKVTVKCPLHVNGSNIFGQLQRSCLVAPGNLSCVLIKVWWLLSSLILRGPSPIPYPCNHGKSSWLSVCSIASCSGCR